MKTRSESTWTPRYVFRLYDVIDHPEEIPSTQVEVHSTNQTWPEVLEDFLRGLLAIGYVIPRKRLQEELSQILDEILPQESPSQEEV